ncbi:MAG: DUF6157 family protein [Candidatus Marinimicrobia bacterium]|nr:DUF6157 family protein [Candidatus Neomarinimicrobiota bacterium]MCF7829140.1 DUF6157 family protein [Candidatus Neomarinimicrobiota bacterium]MCF7881207.1 DUF6157 family protein [Candidatus Neomarinimicrobiota bacterium]
MHTTNYYNTFIEVAEDCPVEESEIPPLRKKKSAVRIQYELISEHPYRFTSDDVIFVVHAEKNDIPEEQRPNAREKFFSNGRACLRSSSLGKRYGWGTHHDADGTVAIYPMESAEYAEFANDEGLDHIKAMRSSRKD